MSERRRGRGASAEVQRLARALDVPPARLEFLADVPPADLRALRLQISDALFEVDRPAFVRAAALSKVVPGVIAAKVTQAVLPPIISARVAEVLDADRAVDMVGRLPDAYVTEVALRMDASRAPQVVEAIPAETVGAIARELVKREEWVVIGSFVSAVSGPSLAASVAVFSGEQLLRIGFVLEDMSRLDEIGTMLSDEQVASILEAAASLGLWAELAEIAGHLSPSRIARFASAFGSASEPVRGAFAAAVDAGELPPEVLAALAAA